MDPIETLIIRQLKAGREEGAGVIEQNPGYTN